MAVSMRHTKLKAEEAALLAGEISKPTWESKNEGIHERVSFEDSIWGFDLAGGIFYKTPLRVTYVKPDSRAEKAGIRPGDKLLRINDIDTSTLTIQQAHDIIIESGIHLKISVTAPEDEEDAYFCYEDPLADGYDSEEERRKEEERARKRRVHAKVSSYWSLAWPWTSRKTPIYRESNCFMVNSKYEEARRDKYPPLPTLRFSDDVVHFSDEQNKKQIPSLYEVKERTRKYREERLTYSETASTVSENEDPTNLINEDTESNHKELDEPRNSNKTVPRIEETDEANVHNRVENVPKTNKNNDVNNNTIGAPENDLLSPIPESLEDVNFEVPANDKEMESNDNGDDEQMDVTSDVETELMNGDVNPDELLNEVLGKSDNIPKGEEDNILDSILSDEGQNLENSEDNER